MTHDTDIDARIRELLREDPVPEHEDGYRERLAALVTVAAEARVVRRPLAGRRPRWIAAAAATAACAAVLATLIGLPGVADRTGPQPVSAAEIVRVAQRALLLATTLSADYVTTEYAVDGPVAGWVEAGVRRARRFLMRADGSLRLTTFEPQGYGGSGLVSRRFADMAYNALHGREQRRSRSGPGVQAPPWGSRVWAMTTTVSFWSSGLGEQRGVPVRRLRARPCGCRRR